MTIKVINSQYPQRPVWILKELSVYLDIGGSRRKWRKLLKRCSLSIIYLFLDDYITNKTSTSTTWKASQVRDVSRKRYHSKHVDSWDAPTNPRWGRACTEIRTNYNAPCWLRSRPGAHCLQICWDGESRRAGSGEALWCFAGILGLASGSSAEKAFGRTDVKYDASPTFNTHNLPIALPSLERRERKL